MARAEYIKRIGQTHFKHIGTSYCARDITKEFHFADIDHVAHELLKNRD